MADAAKKSANPLGVLGSAAALLRASLNPRGQISVTKLFSGEAAREVQMGEMELQLNQLRMEDFQAKQQRAKAEAELAARLAPVAAPLMGVPEGTDLTGVPAKTLIEAIAAKKQADLKFENDAAIMYERDRLQDENRADTQAFQRGERIAGQEFQSDKQEDQQTFTAEESKKGFKRDKRMEKFKGRQGEQQAVISTRRVERGYLESVSALLKTGQVPEELKGQAQTLVDTYRADPSLVGTGALKAFYEKNILGTGGEMFSMETPEGMKLSIGKGKGGMDALRNSTVAAAVSDIQNAETGINIINQIREIATANRVGTRGFFAGKSQDLFQQLTPESPQVTAARSEAAKLQGIAGATKAFQRTFDAGIPASQAMFEALAIVAANAIGLGSGGRLSDQDIERVYTIIGGSPDQLLQSPPKMNAALDVLENLLTSKAQQKGAMLQAVGAPPQSLGAKVPGQLPPPDKWGSMSTAERQKILDGTNGGTK